MKVITNGIHALVSYGIVQYDMNIVFKYSFDILNKIHNHLYNNILIIFLNKHI
jgi:hypothetical protein